MTWADDVENQRNAKLRQEYAARAASFQFAGTNRIAELEAENLRLRTALCEFAAVAWKINDTVDRSEADRYYLASTNDWDDLHEVLHKHLKVINEVQE